METLLFAITAVLPIIILMAIGYFLKHIKFLSDEFLVVANKFVYRISLPALLFYNIYKIESFSAIEWNHVWFASAGIVFLFVLGMILVKLMIPDEKQKGVIVQVIFRANFVIIGVPLAQAIGGEQAVINLSMISAIAIPLMNILSVIALTIYVHNEESGQIKSTLVKIIKNPLIIGIFLALLVLYIRSFIPLNDLGEPVFMMQNQLKFIFLPIQWLAQTTSPLALIVLGGTFEFYVIKHLSRQIFIGTVMRAFFAPLIVLSAAVIIDQYSEYFNFNYLVYPAFIALFASPTAITGAVMAKEMGNDSDLANQCVVWTTIVSIFSIFLTVLILRFAGIL
ncbi:MAG: AEC family transporter [Tenericutes bacterium]|jgi:predicted permease|nr:AEC family transporter [Mycoplasmatota bacterium]